MVNCAWSPVNSGVGFPGKSLPDSGSGRDWRGVSAVDLGLGQANGGTPHQLGARAAVEMAPNPRHVEGGSLAELVDEDRNARVLAYLAEHRPSCHSDTGDALLRSAEECGDWIAFSPSFRQLRYVALVTNRTVFALGLGQCSVFYRLPESLFPTALATGAVEASEVGPNWARFDLWRADWPTPDLVFWTRKAYAGAREGT